MSRQEILDKVAKAVKTHKNDYEKMIFSKPVKIDESKSPLEDFIERSEFNKNKLIKSSEENLEKDLLKLLEEIGAKNIFYTPNIEIEGLKKIAKPYDKEVEELKDQLFSSDAFIVKASCAVRDLGLIGLHTSKDSPRLASLIPDTCIFLLPKEKLVANMLEAVDFLKKDGLSTNTLLIAGPSRTADIELITVFGVHGPRVTWIILY